MVAGGVTLDATDPYTLQNELPPRFQANSAFAANLTSINTLRQAETSNGALKFQALQDNPFTLCGRRMWEVSNMDSLNYVLVLGDWSQFVITDRVGSTVDWCRISSARIGGRPVNAVSSAGSARAQMCWWTTHLGFVAGRGELKTSVRAGHRFRGPGFRLPFRVRPPPRGRFRRAEPRVTPTCAYRRPMRFRRRRR